MTHHDRPWRATSTRWLSMWVTRRASSVLNRTYLNAGPQKLMIQKNCSLTCSERAACPMTCSCTRDVPSVSGRSHAVATSRLHGGPGQPCVTINMWLMVTDELQPSHLLDPQTSRAARFRRRWGHRRTGMPARESITERKPAPATTRTTRIGHTLHRARRRPPRRTARPCDRAVPVRPVAESQNGSRLWCSLLACAPRAPPCRIWWGSLMQAAPPCRIWWGSLMQAAPPCRIRWGPLHAGSPTVQDSVGPLMQEPKGVTPAPIQWTLVLRPPGPPPSGSTSRGRQQTRPARASRARSRKQAAW